MNEYLISILGGLGGGFVGGLFSLLSSWIVMNKENQKNRENQEKRFKEEDKKWLRENRLNLFIELVDVLEGYQIPIIFEEDNYEFGYIDIEEVNRYINSTNEYISNNKGKLFLFLPPEVFSQIVRLKEKACKIIFSTKPQKIYYRDFKNSDMYEIIVEAKKISQNIRNVIGIE